VSQTPRCPNPAPVYCKGGQRAGKLHSNLKDVCSQSGAGALPWSIATQEDAREAEEGDSDEDAGERVSKKKRKQENRLKIAELKQTCQRPEVVEVWDVTAPDPRLLVFLKVSTNYLQLPHGQMHTNMGKCMRG
jgi:hypothetical protein